MGLFDRFSRKTVTARRIHSPNPHTHMGVRSAGFFSKDVGRLLSGWETDSSSIDYYLQAELTELRARSRKMVRSNPYGKRFIATIKSNVVGPVGIGIQAQSLMGMNLDTSANDAIEAAFKDWAQNHCDYRGRTNFVDMQNLAISCAGQDGEFLFRKHHGKSAGAYGYSLESIDPELLDTRKNTPTRNGQIRLGVEYDASGRIIQYHFRSRNADGTYGHQNGYIISAKNIIHGFIAEWPDQSRGAPWMHSSLERSKHLEKYEEAAIVKARSTAATMAVMRTPAGEQGYEGEEDGGDGITLDAFEAGTIKDIGNREITNLDSSYPHQMYAAFVKSQLQGIASGLGISYHSLSNDLEGVNYSSIRSGVLEDREVYKGLQSWFIRSFMRPVYEEWLSYAYMSGAIKINTRPLARPIQQYMPAHFQARRWAWVDPLKDGNANKLAIDYRLKSHSQVMREQGDDPDSVWREIARDQDMMKQLGIAPIASPDQPETEESPDD